MEFTHCELIDRATGNVESETLTIREASIHLARKTGRESSELEHELRSGRQHATAGFVFQPIRKE